MVHGDFIERQAFAAAEFRGRLRSTHDGAYSDADTERIHLPGVSPGLVREYEDYFLGKLYTDSSFERGSDVLAHYSSPCDKAKGLAFLLGQMEEQTEFEGVILIPGVLRDLVRNEPAEVLAEGWRTLGDELPEDLTEQYGNLIAKVRITGETLVPEDVFELEHETALAGFGPRVALRQMLSAANAFSSAMPRRHIPGRSRHVAVPSNILDEDTYSIGGLRRLPIAARSKVFCIRSWRTWKAKAPSGPT